MGRSSLTDAQNIKIDETLLSVLHQLDQPLSEMDTAWIDSQLDSVPEIAASSEDVNEQIALSAAAADKVQKIRAARRRMLKRATAIAAGLMLVAAGTFGVANAFQWNSFLRIFSAQNGILSFQTPVEKDGNISSLETNELQDDSADDTTSDLITIGSAEELLSLSTEGDKAFKPLLNKYTLQSGDLYRTETDELLTLIFLDASGNDLNIQISTVNEEYIDHVAASIFFEIDDGSQKNVRIGDATVITCVSQDVNTVQWITQYGYCHIFSKASHEELLDIAKILLDAGLKPV